MKWYFAGATPMESFSCKPEKYLGSLDTVNHVILNKKSYLHLERASSGMNTLVLCNLEEEMVSELKVVRNICKCFKFFQLFFFCSEWFLFESSILLLTLYKIRGVYSWASELTKLCGIRNFGERLQATKINTMYFPEVL